ncbi:FkbM family methyltransferase [Algoriphagus sp.]|uniref:FkbM family methyltransferase n=1 Tax=Algoriphagus sp. TaxID=1872435 RepID=UPI00327542FF
MFSSTNSKLKIIDTLYSFLPTKLINILVNRYFYFEKLNRSYSQEGEDLLLNRYFKNKPEGFFCDVGSFHPKQYSNTYLFYQRGWRGINIDPRPGSKKIFDQVRPDDINLELGIADQPGGQLVYKMYANPVYNSFSSEAVENVEKIGEVFVDIQSLEYVFSTYLPKDMPIDFLSIDVEGFDLEVLKSNDWARFRPEVVIIEFFGQSIQVFLESEIYTYLNGLGYVYFANTVNTYFFHTKKVS